GAVRDRAGVALVLLEMRECLAADELYLRIGQSRCAHGFRDESEQLAEIVAEALRAEHRGVRPDVEARHCAKRIERGGPGRGIALLRAAQHRLRRQTRDARSAGGLEPLPRLDGEEHRGRAKARDRDRRDAQAVRERAPVDLVHAASPSGTNQPTLRDRSTKRALAASRICSRVTAASLSYHSLIDVAAPVERS